MPYQPTNPYPYNTAIDLNDGLVFSFKVDNYDTINEFKIEIYDLLKNEKLYTIFRTVGMIEKRNEEGKEQSFIVEGEEQLIQILDAEENQLLLEIYKGNSLLPIKGGQGIKSIAELDVTPYIASLETLEKKKNYGDVPNCEELKITDPSFFEIDKEGTITKYLYKNVTTDVNIDLENIVIPYKINNIQVKKIGAGVFKEDNNLKTIVIPSCVFSIEEEAFSYCQNLEQVFLNYGVSKIKKSAFCFCRNLVEINLLDSIDTIEQEAFKNCGSLDLVRLPHSLETLSYAVFFCTGIYKLELPPELSTIEERAFCGCEILHTVICNDKLNSIGTKAFDGCYNLSLIKFNENLQVIGEEALKDCRQLTEIILPNSLQEIGKGVVSNCERLEKITVPFVGRYSNSNLNEEAVLGYFFNFMLSSTLEYVAVEQYYSQEDEVVYYIPISLKTVVLTNCDFVPHGAFCNCTMLSKVILPSMLNRIENYAFYNCNNITEIILPPTIQYIGDYAFALEENNTLN